jgi:hypothetical protein
MAGDQSPAMGTASDGYALANQPDGSGCPGVVALVGLGVPGCHRSSGRGNARRVAADQPGDFRRVGGPVLAGVVAALDGVRTQAARVAACLRARHQTGRRTRHCGNQPALARFQWQTVPGARPAPGGGRRALGCLAGRGSGTPGGSIAPAIRDGLVRVSGIDPKGMELAYGRGIFHRYAVTGTDAVALLDELVAAMDDRKAEFAGRVRSVPISTQHPLELLEFDEIGALTKYTDRKTREAITEQVALLTTQGRALGFTVRGYVQEPTKDTVPVRELFPRRICLRVSAKSHVSMVLGDQAYERGAWANRITESEAGVGYVFGEGLREPLRIRAGWVPDETIKQLQTFVTGPVEHDTTVLPFPPKPTNPGSTRGGAA